VIFFFTVNMKAGQSRPPHEHLSMFIQRLYYGCISNTMPWLQHSVI